MNEPKPYFTEIDLSDNELKQAVLENRPTHPTHTKSGRIYLNTTDDVLYCYVGGDWVDITKFYTHPSHTEYNIDLDNNRILAKISVNAEGHIENLETRLLTLSDLGFNGDTNANYYEHPTLNMNGTGLLGGANVISNINLNSDGHVTGITTREITPEDIGAVTINDNVTSSLNTWSSQKITNVINGLTFDDNGVFRLRGGYDIVNNVPEIFSITTKRGHVFIIVGEGTFAGELMPEGTFLIANVDNPQSDEDWYIMNRGRATETADGVVRMATDQAIIDGTVETTAVQPHQLDIWFEHSEVNDFEDPYETYIFSRG